MYEDILRCPTCMDIVKTPKNYLPEAEEALSNATEERYQAAISGLMNATDRRQAQEAYRNFLRVEQLTRNYKDTPQRTIEALNAATLKSID